MTVIPLSFLWNIINDLGISQKIQNSISRRVPLPSIAVRQTHFLVRHALLSMHKLCSWVRSAQGGVKSLCWNEPQGVLGEPWEGGGTAHGNSHPSQSSLRKPQWTPTEAVREARLIPVVTCPQILLHGRVSVLQSRKVQQLAGTPGKEYFREMWHHWLRPKAKQTGLFAIDLCQQCRLKTETCDIKRTLNQAGRDTESPPGANFHGTGSLKSWRKETMTLF